MCRDKLRKQRNNVYRSKLQLKLWLVLRGTRQLFDELLTHCDTTNHTVIHMQYDTGELHNINLISSRLLCLKPTYHVDTPSWAIDTIVSIRTAYLFTLRHSSDLLWRLTQTYFGDPQLNLQVIATKTHKLEASIVS